MTPFAKVQSIGNDFVLVEANHVIDSDLSQLAKRLCERRFSVGSDGLLVVGPVRDDRISMKMFNPDGTEDFCGNGLRCAAVYAFGKGWCGESFVIEHGGREIPASVDACAGIGAVSIETQIGFATFDPAKVPHTMASELFEGPLEVEGEVVTMSALSTGSTHTILIVDELPDDARFFALSRALEHHAVFPQRTSVIWVRRDTDSDIRLRIWERGVGETLGCGTGSSAAAATVARLSGAPADGGFAFNVHNPGGTVTVRMSEWSAPIRVTGSAKVVFEGEF